MEIIFGDQSSLKRYGLILKSYYLTPPVRKRHLYSVPGGDGDVDLMKGLGPVRYEKRTLRAEFTICNVNPERTVDRILDELEGATLPIVLPNNPSVYLEGDVHVTSASVQSGGIVVLTASCLPWRYRLQETVIDIPAADEATAYSWYNEGKRDAVPEVITAGTVYITCNGTNMTLSAGTHLISALQISGGSSINVTVRGDAATVRYREAIL